MADVSIKAELVGWGETMEVVRQQWWELVAEAEEMERRGMKVVLRTYSDGSMKGEGMVLFGPLSTQNYKN